ncbi:MAG: hypothetical protein ACR2KU_00515 [Gammaproteobacteria bacterium]
MPQLATVSRAYRPLCGIRPEDELGGLQNGLLLAKAEKELDAFLTGDRNLSFQQNSTM